MFLSRTFFLVLILGIMVSPLSAGEVEDLKATFDKAPSLRAFWSAPSITDDT